MAEEKRGSLGEGVRTGIGILTAFKEALEETLKDASERGDFSPERAKHMMNDAVHRAQESLEEARERLDFVPRKEFDALRREVAELKEMVRGGASGPSAPSPDRVAAGDSPAAGAAAGDHIPVD
jgi:polyhydroxyalkanoate synthesis regulator phasin